LPTRGVGAEHVVDTLAEVDPGGEPGVVDHQPPVGLDDRPSNDLCQLILADAGAGRELGDRLEDVAITGADGRRAAATGHQMSTAVRAARMSAVAMVRGWGRPRAVRASTSTVGPPAAISRPSTTRSASPLRTRRCTRRPRAARH